MRIQSPVPALAIALLLLFAPLGTGCGGDESLPEITVDGNGLLAQLAARQEVLEGEADEALLPVIRHLGAAERGEGLGPLTIDYPLDESVFPPEIVPPTVLWHDASGADAWFVEVAFADGGAPLRRSSGAARPRWARSTPRPSARRTRCTGARPTSSRRGAGRSATPRGRR